MAQTDRQTEPQTDGHGDSMTNSAQWGRVGEKPTNSSMYKPLKHMSREKLYKQVFSEKKRRPKKRGRKKSSSIFYLEYLYCPITPVKL